MRDFFDEHGREIDLDGTLLLVVGAHLEAELTDRALAYRLRETILETPCERRLLPIVCTDLWYLNNQPLRLRPTIALGRPEINAVTAYLASRVPTALVIEDAYRIQLDPELIDLKACVWGAEARDTAAALGCFIERYLPGYLEAAEQYASNVR
jgi:hypothetical protein